MRQKPVLEKYIVARIMAVLKKVPGLVIRKRHGTVMGMAGDPDLYGSYRGRHFEIEVKRPCDSRSELTTLQACATSVYTTNTTRRSCSGVGGPWE